MSPIRGASLGTLRESAAGLGARCGAIQREEPTMEHADVDRLSYRLRWLGKLRWAAAGGLAGLALFVHFALGLTLAWGPLVLLAVIVSAYNLLLGFWASRLEAGCPRGLGAAQFERITRFQIALDLLVLTLALHFSGGLTNPLVMLYLLPPVTAGLLLSPLPAYLLASWATLLFVGMAVCHSVWPATRHPIGGYPPSPFFWQPPFIAGEAIALAVSAHVSVYLARAVATRLRRHEGELADAHHELEARSGELGAMNRELRELEERKSRFLSLTAHQLRGPLAATEGCLACVADGYVASPEKQAELISRARMRIQGMLQIVRDLLTLAAVHELTAAPKMTRVHLDSVAGRVADQYLDYAASRQIDLVFCPGAHEVEVMGDERALADCLGNLVSNAIKYTPEGGHVKVSTRVARSEAICEVIDDGIGIPESEKEGLFREFFRATNARASGQEGTGLGLAIVREVVERHGGRLKVESIENLGACAVVSLPIASPAAGGV